MGFSFESGIPRVRAPHSHTARLFNPPQLHRISSRGTPAGHQACGGSDAAGQRLSSQTHVLTCCRGLQLQELQSAAALQARGFLSLSVEFSEDVSTSVKVRPAAAARAGRYLHIIDADAALCSHAEQQGQHLYRFNMEQHQVCHGEHHEAAAGLQGSGRQQQGGQCIGSADLQLYSYVGRAIAIKQPSVEFSKP